MARMILPNATKTELVMTGFESDWKHFFELRCSGAAHPDARYLADKLKTLITKNDGN
jgi:thymidylate synthase (FAD)